jgi:hypothetical protein
MSSVNAQPEENPEGGANTIYVVAHPISQIHEATCYASDDHSINRMATQAQGGELVEGVVDQFNQAHMTAFNNLAKQAETVIRNIQTLQAVQSIGYEAIALAHLQALHFLDSDQDDQYPINEWHDDLVDHHYTTAEPLPGTGFEVGISLMPRITTEIPGQPDSTQTGYAKYYDGSFLPINETTTAAAILQQIRGFRAPLIMKHGEHQAGEELEIDGITSRHLAARTLIALYHRLNYGELPDSAVVTEGVCVIPVLEETVSSVQSIDFCGRVQKVDPRVLGATYTALIKDGQFASERVIQGHENSETNLGSADSNPLLHFPARDEEAKLQPNAPFARPTEEGTMSIVTIPVIISHKPNNLQGNSEAPQIAYGSTPNTTYLSLDASRPPSLSHIDIIASYYRLYVNKTTPM